jgi:ferritin-like metal-binding protein YciE
MKLKDLKDLYIHELKDLHSAEKQITKALPKMAEAAGSNELATAFRDHLNQTHEHVWRLEKILGRHGQSVRGPKCKGMEGLLKEGAEMIEADAEDEVRDAGLISTAQRVEHYEIAAYGCARTYAELLGDEEGVCLLKATLSEEKATDEKLTDLARSINVDAEVAVA